MRSRSALLCLILAIGCGADSGTDADGVCVAAPASIHACAIGLPGAEIDIVESKEELARDRVGREKGILPACLLLISPELSCEFMPGPNETRCTGSPWGVMPEKQITVKWHDQDCGSYDGDVFLHTGATARELVARLTPIEPGLFHVENLSVNFDFGILFTGTASLIFDDGLCHVNLKPGLDAEGVSSSVGLCTDP